MSLPSDKTHILGLNGLRGISVLLVFLHHTGLVPIHGGFIGVDIFFVLSGYLITTLLTREYEKKGNISIFTFYWRRARRLYPALLFFLIFVAIYALIFNPKINGTQEIVPALLYYMNWVRAFGGYDAVITGHTWSLAIEEQFYLVWPIVLTLLLWHRLRKNIICILGVMIIAVILWRMHLFGVNAPASRTYCGFDTRSDGLLMGAFLAHVGRPWMLRIGKTWTIAAAYIIFVLTTKAGDDLAVTALGFALTSIAAAIIIAKVVTAQEGTLTRVLEETPLSGLGQVSYGFYLWHYAVIQVLLYRGHDQFGAYFGGFTHPRIVMLGFSFMVTLLFTLISWYAIESPILNNQKKSKSNLDAIEVCETA